MSDENKTRVDLQALNALANQQAQPEEDIDALLDKARGVTNDELHEALRNAPFTLFFPTRMLK